MLTGRGNAIHCRNEQEVKELAEALKKLDGGLDSLNLSIFPPYHDQVAEIVSLVKKSLFFSMTSNAQVSPSFFNAIECHSTLSTLSLRHCDLSTQIPILSNVLRKRRNITHLDICGNLLSHQSCENLANLLEDMSCYIRHLNVSQCGLGMGGVRPLGLALKKNTSIHELNVSSNNMRAEGVRHVTEGLKMNQTIEYLDVCDNNIGPVGAKLMAEVLKTNGNISKLWMENNYIESVGIEALENNLLWNGTLRMFDLKGKTVRLRLLIERNMSMFLRAQEIVLYMLMIKKSRKTVMSWMPREVVMWICQTIWATRTDIVAWRRPLGEEAPQKKAKKE